ncbi:MAG: CAP family protein [Flavobacteriales bacterium]|jgi:hypothetical protein
MRITVLLFITQIAWIFHAQTTVALDTSIQRIILQQHNAERALLNIPGLSWNKKIAAYAEEWALKLATDDAGIVHRKSHLYGENISWIGGLDDLQVDVRDGVSLWTDEKQYFKYKPIGDGWAKSGHYTQVIWKKTTEVGCGCAISESGNFFIVCNYNPHGNTVGEKPY